MTSDPAAPIGTAKSQLRGRIIGTYQRAQRIIMAAASSPSANTHAATIAYDKAREHLRADILLASNVCRHGRARGLASRRAWCRASIRRRARELGPDCQNHAGSE